MNSKMMFLILGIYLIQIYPLEAQNAAGYYITNTLDTIRVNFDPPTELFGDRINFIKLQSKVKYFDSLNKKQSLKPEMAKEFSFVYLGERIRMISMRDRDGVGAFNTFKRLKIDGKLKLYYEYGQEYIGSPGMGGGYRTVLKYVVQLEKQPLLRFGDFAFRKDLIEYIIPCPDLKHKIEEKIYDRGDMDKIVNEYNASCK